MIKLKLWEATLKVGVELMGRSTPGMLTVKIVAEHFEQAAVMALEAANEQLKESKTETKSIELLGVQSMGVAWTSAVEVMPAIGSIN